MVKTHTKSVVGLLLALVMIFTMMPIFSMAADAAAAAAPTGSITLRAPFNEKDGEREYVDLGDMTVYGYRILDEANIVSGEPGSMFTVNTDFVDFFADVTDAFYTPENGFWTSDGVLGANDKMYISYDAENNKLAVSNESKGVGVTEIVVEPAKMKDLILYHENKDYFAAALMEAILSGGETVAGGTNTIANSANSKTIATWLRKYIAIKDIKPVEGKRTNNPGTAQDYIEFSDIPLGYWLLTSSNAPYNVANVETVFRLAQQKDNEPSEIDAQLKLEEQKLDKTVKKDGTADYADSTTAQAGGILNYKVETIVPNLPDYDGSQLLEAGKSAQDYVFKISDTLSNQWLVTEPTGDDSKRAKVSGADDNATPVADFTKKVFTVTITWKDSEAEATTHQLILTDDPAKADSDADPYVKQLKEYLKDTGASKYGTYDEETHTQTFILDFDIAKLSAFAKAHDGDWKEATMTVTYSAELTSDAVLQNDNEVNLQYSNDPKTASRVVPLPRDETKVYTYGFEFGKEFEKSGSSDPLTPEAGDEEYKKLAEKVVFELYSVTKEGYTWGGDTTLTDADLSEAIAVVKKEAGKEGNYIHPDSDDTAVADPAKTQTSLMLGDDGHLYVYGLAPGYYVLKETSSPTGYTRIKEIVVYLDANGVVYNEPTAAYEGTVTLGQNTDNESFTAGPEEEPAKKATEEGNYLHFTATNRRGMNLPETGGAGVWMLLIGGILLMTLAGALVLNHKKHNSAE